jgi:hypothetical protein
MKILPFNGSAIEIAKMVGEVVPSRRVGRSATKGSKGRHSLRREGKIFFSTHKSAKVDRER